MGLREWLRTLRRDREQLTVELAERSVAPEGEVRATEARIERDAERHGEHTEPGGEESTEA